MKNLAALFLLTLMACIPTPLQAQRSPPARRALAVGHSGTGNNQQPDVFLILADDVAYDDLMPMLAANKLPNIQRIASHGTTFHCGYANGVCSPTRQSLQLGRWRFGDMGLSCDDNAQTVPTNELTLAELNTTGRSGLFGKWHIGANPVGPWPFLYIPFGYETWFGTPVNLGNICDSENYNDWTRVDNGQVTLHVTSYEPLAIRDKAMAWLALAAGSPRFLDYRPALAHGPFHNPPASLLPSGYSIGFGNRAKFEAMIIALDTTIGPILDQVDWVNDLVLFIGDNGTPEQVTPLPGRSKTTCFERGIHVPFFVSGPGFPVGDSNALVHVVDVYPTLASFWGTTPQANDGVCLVATPGHDTIVCTGTDDVMARTGSVKLRRLVSDGDEQLFDLATDPQENTNLLGNPSYAFVEDKLRTAVDAFLARNPQ